MVLPGRQVLMGMIVGALGAAALAAIGPGVVLDAFAGEMPAGFDTDGLVKFEERYFQIDYEPWVATAPITTARVKKIEAGRVSYVDISTTATGTYSSDALTSRHVLYPGIQSREVFPHGGRATFSFWSHGRWQGFSVYDGNSFISISN